jgi:acyl carrier protein
MSESKEEIFVAVAAIFADMTDVSAENVQLESMIREDLDADSLTLAELGVALQDRFNVEIPDEEVVELKTVSDVVSVIYSALVPA